jgi:photoactive yellow protein
MEIIPFGSKDVDNILQREPQRAEFLPFGAVLLDRAGKIVKYNQAEGLIVGRNPADVIGKDFFNEIAPCAKGKRFHGEFLKFARTGQLNVMLDYEFDYKMKPVRVRIHMKSAPDGQQCWMFVKRI